MEEQLVSLEVAKLLKEKGFNIPCRYCYGYCTESICDFITERRGTIYEDEYNGHDWNYEKFPLIGHATSAPTQSLAQKWLRETKNIVVIADYDSVYPKPWNYEIWEGLIRVVDSFERFNCYEEALEEGLKEALKLI